MNFNNVVIDSFDYVDPPQFITSDEFEERLSPIYKRLKLPEGRLELQTSIKSRGMWPVGTRPSDIATQAGKKVLLKSKIKDIDLLIHSSVCRDFLEPSTSSYIHKNLELPSNCISYDLSNACLGFINAMDLAAKQIEVGIIKTALIVTGENSGPLIEETIKKLNADKTLTRKSIKKFIANLTIGSAGVAFLLAHKDISDSKIHIHTTHSKSDTQASNLCQGTGGTDSLMMETSSSELLEAGISLADLTFKEFLQKTKEKNFDHLISHQVGIAHTTLLYKTLGLDLNKDYSTFSKYGNTGSAAVPLTFCKAMEENLIKEGGSVALLGIGSGLHSIMMELKC